MAQRPEVPKFSNQESEDNDSYMAYFDDARKGRSDAKMNPKGIPDTHLEGQSPSRAASFQEETEPKNQKGPEKVRARHQHQQSQDEGDMRKPTNSPFHHDAVGRKTSVDSPHHRLSAMGTDSPKRVSRQSLGSDRSVEHSPLHPNHQSRLGNKGTGVSSHSWERKGSTVGSSSHGLAPLTPGRSRLRPVTRGDETPDHSPAVPKFGDWDETDPAAAEGFTQVFERVREERQSGTGRVPIMPTDSSYSNGQRQYGNDDPKKGCFCFPWGKK